MTENADLPKSTWVMHSGDTHITNDRSLLLEARDCDESLYGIYGNSMQAQAIGEVALELQNDLTLRLKEVRYVPDAKYNLLSQFALAKETEFIISFGSGKVFMVHNGMRHSIASNVAQKFVFVTKQPTIDEVIEFAKAHPTNDVDCLSTYTQDSDIGRYHRNRY